MDIIQFKEANCKNCYKCIRNCELKSIKFSNEQAYILDNDCVLCGKCTLICPQNAKQIKSDLPKIKKYIKNGYKIYASIAPSYVSAFPNASFSQISAALKKLGFSRIEETSIGATKVSNEYGKLLEEKKMKNIITTCCPTIVLLVEKYYPELIEFLAPVVSPATAHSKMMKELFGNRIKVVFIGPCISKKYEAELSTNINAVLMFEELESWLQSENIKINEFDNDPSEMHSTLSRLYPVPGGILQTIPQEKRKLYKCISVDGFSRCISTLKSLRDDEIEGYFIEMSSCENSCVGGPGLCHSKNPFLSSRETIFLNANTQTVSPLPMTEDMEINLNNKYHNIKVNSIVPDEETIEAILLSIGKSSKESMLNCSTCGYDTCRDKAIAVYQGKSDLKMCLPYLREKAESLSNVILENTPNATFLLDKELNIIEYNYTAEKMFNLNKDSSVNKSILLYLSEEGFNEILENGNPINDLLCKTRDEKLTVSQTIVSVPKWGYLVILKDKTKEEERIKSMAALRKSTIEIAQNVIDKQMRVAQEIASLLGETTGETKAALTKLKKTIEQEDKV